MYSIKSFRSAGAFQLELPKEELSDAFEPPDIPFAAVSDFPCFLLVANDVIAGRAHEDNSRIPCSRDVVVALDSPS